MTIEIVRLWFKKYGKIFSFVFAIAVSVTIFIFRSDIAKLGEYNYLGLFLLNVFGSATIFLPTPLFLTAVAASTFLNPVLVTVFASLGSATGEMTGYLLGYGSEEIIEDNKTIKKVKSWMDKYGIWTIFVLSAVPNPVFDVAGIIAGASQIPLYKFWIAAWLGKLIKFALIVLLGVNTFTFVDNYF